MISNPTVVVLKTLDMIFPSSSVNPHMKELGVCIPFLNTCDAGALLFSRPLQGGKRNDFSFKPTPEVSLVCTKKPLILRHVKVENDKQRRMQQHLGVGEKASTPSG
jgi:hypothetical protein